MICGMALPEISKQSACLLKQEAKLIITVKISDGQTRTSTSCVVNDGTRDQRQRLFLTPALSQGGCGWLHSTNGTMLMLVCVSCTPMRLGLMRGRRQTAYMAWAGQVAADTEDRQPGPPRMFDF